MTTWQEIISEQPKLHNWGGKWCAGGLSQPDLTFLGEFIEKIRFAESAGIIETGAGLSTLVFLASPATHIITVCKDEAIKQRIMQYAENKGIDVSRLEYHVGFSEDLLPGIVLGRPPFADIALIDGGHGMTTAFVDLHYLNYALRSGGLLVVDDIQLHSCREVYLFLANLPGFELVRNSLKTAFFIKRTPARAFGDFNEQPHVKHNSWQPV